MQCEFRTQRGFICQGFVKGLLQSCKIFVNSAFVALNHNEKPHKTGILAGMNFFQTISLGLRRLCKRLPLNIASMLALVMLMLLPIFAVVQYRWLGQLSESQQEQRRSQLQNTTLIVGQEINEQYGLLQQTFCLTEEELAAQSLEDLMQERLDRWMLTAHSPLLAQIFYVNADEMPHAIEEYVFGERRFLRQDASKVRGVIDQILSEPLAQMTNVPHYVHHNLSMIAVPIMSTAPQQNFVVLRLDMAYFQSTFLPELKSKYLPQTSDVPYRMAIADSSNLIYTSDTTFGWKDVRKAHSHSVIGLMPPLQVVLMLRQHRPLPLQMPPSQRALPEKYPIPNALNAPAPFTALSPARAGNMRFPRQELNRMLGDSSINVLTRMINIPELVIEYGSGKLELQVETLRWRNVAISFGMLLLLAGVMMLLVVLSIRTERLARQQMQFVAGVSHELRTPITVIRLASENLSDGLIADSAMARQYGDLILQESNKLWGLVEQTLEFAGIQAGKRTFDMQALDLAPIIHSALTDVQLLAKEKGIKIVAEIPNTLPLVQADSAAVRSVMVNLLTNAIKYSRNPEEPATTREGTVEGGIENTVIVRSSISAQQALKNNGNFTPLLTIAVQDFGRGIAKKDLDHIFEPFYRSDDVVQEQISGSGLGLAMVKYVMESHRGSVSVESSQYHQPASAHGSTFILQFPLSHHTHQSP